MSFHKKNMWGVLVRPGLSYDGFKRMRAEGLFHPAYTWRQCCAAHRKRIRKIKIAKMSRRKNRRK